MSEEVTRQIKAVFDPLPKQLDLLIDVMKSLEQSSFRRNDETECLAEGSSRALNTKSDKIKVNSSSFHQKENGEEIFQLSNGISIFFPETDHNAQNLCSRVVHGLYITYLLRHCG